MKLAFVCDAIQFDDCYYVDKVDSMKSAIESMAKDGYEINFFAMSTKAHQYLNNGILYNFATSHLGMMEAIRKFMPDGFVMKSFYSNVNRSIAENFPKEPKLLIFCGGELNKPRMNVDKVMVASKTMKDILVTKGYPANKIFDFAFTVDTELFKPDPKMPKKYDAIYVADWRENKRQEMLIQAMEMQRFKVCFVGAQTSMYNEEYYKAMQRFIARLNMQSSVTCVDRMKGVDTVPYYQQSRVCVHLGMPAEGGARSLLEGMSCALPVLVTSDCLSNASRVEHMTEGIHSAPAPNHIAHHMRYLLKLSNADQYKMGLAGRTKVETLWYNKRMEEAFRNFFGA